MKRSLVSAQLTMLLTLGAYGCLPAEEIASAVDGNENPEQQDTAQPPSDSPVEPTSPDPAQPGAQNPAEPTTPEPTQPATPDPAEPAPPEPAEPSPPPPAEVASVTVAPRPIDEVLTNPGMGFANFHFGWWCDLPADNFAPQQCVERVERNWPQNYPDTGTAYFRWHWRDLEPARGQIDFDMIDAAIQSANAMGMTLAFRVMTIDEGQSGVPDWLTSSPYNAPGEWRPGDGGSTFWPNYADPTYQSEHRRLLKALGDRYNGHPAVDHIDIGTVGCWGEWNTVCLFDAGDVIDIYDPANDSERQQIAAAYMRIIDHHLSAFPDTPLVMLGMHGTPEDIDILLHATQGGAGWRVDCWGDWGIWGDGWNHQRDFYPAMIADATAVDPSFAEVWKGAPIQLEICSTMPEWESRGWTASDQVQKTFQWALDQHASVLNAKSTALPDSYLGAIDELLKKNGYRFVIDGFTHDETVQAGSSTTFVSDWSNLGVAPSYLTRTLSYRLRGASGEVRFASSEDIRSWLPGSWTVSDTISIPADLPQGSYEIDIAILDREGSAPTTEALPPLALAIEGRRADGWYTVSELTVQ